MQTKMKMDKSALTLIIIASLGLSACSSLPFGKKKQAEATAKTAPEDEALVPNVPNAEGTETINAADIPPAPKRGFASNLARALGGDSNTANVGPCPAVRVLYDASRFVEFPNGQRKGADGVTPQIVFEDVGFTGEIQKVTSSCRYLGADPIDVEVNIEMGLGKGPKAEGNTKLVKYWVSVTRKDIAPISHKAFTGEVIFQPGQDRMNLKVPQIGLSIPRLNQTISGANFEIIVGFELSPEQLEFNRNGVRFKVDAGAPK